MINKTKHPLYWKHASMLSRCNNPNTKSYKNYGGRGIEVCARWSGEIGFANFIEDMGELPTPKHTIERIDNNGDYEPSNCRWATRAEQFDNRRLQHNNKTGHANISIHRSKHYLVSMPQNGKQLFIGTFKNLTDAIEAKQNYIRKVAR